MVARAVLRRWRLLISYAPVKLMVDSGTLYLNNKHFCLVGAGNGRNGIRHGSGKVYTKYSPEHGRVLAYSDEHGWIGASSECDIVLGRVRHRANVLPCVVELDRLVWRIEEHEFGDGEACTITVNP